MPQRRLWDDPGYTLPANVDAVTTMLTRREQQLLYWLAREWFEGEGAICDLGAYLGGSTVCFAQGLRDAGFARRGYLYSYDMFVAGNSERDRPEFAEGLPEHNSTFPLFERNLAGLHDLLVVKVGDVEHHVWPDNEFADPTAVEVLFVDIAKGYNTWDHVVRTYFPWLIPGRSLVILQDYFWGTTGPWHHVVMERLAPYFTRAIDAGVAATMVFQCTAAIPAAELEAAMWDAIAPEERRRLMEQAVALTTNDRDRSILEEILAALDERTGWRYSPLAYGHVAARGAAEAACE